MNLRPREFASDAFQVNEIRRALTESSVGDLVFRDKFFPKGRRLRDLAANYSEYNYIVSLIYGISAEYDQLVDDYETLLSQTISITSSLQNQLDNLDSIYTTDANLAGVSGYLQSEIIYNTVSITDLYSIINSLSGYPVSVADVARISGYLYSEITYIENNYTTLAETARISAYLDGRINQIDTTTELRGITGYLQNEIDSLEVISNDHEARIQILETTYTSRAETLAISAYLNQLIDDVDVTSQLTDISSFLQNEVDRLRSDVVGITSYIQSEIDNLQSSLDYMTLLNSISGYINGSFTYADLSGGILYISHNLNAVTPGVVIYNNEDRVITPNDVTIVDDNSVTISLVTFGVIPGTWRYTIQRSKGGVTVNTIEAISGVNLLSLETDIIPLTGNTYSLGTSAFPWKDAYFSGSTLYVGNKPITVVGNDLKFNGQLVVIESPSQIVGDATKSEVSQLTGNINSRINQLVVISGSHSNRIANLENTYTSRAQITAISAYLDSRITAISSSVQHDNTQNIQGINYHLSSSQISGLIGKTEVSQISGYLQSELVSVSASIYEQRVTSHNVLSDLSGSNVHPASSISVSTNAFVRNFSSLDTTLQKAFDTINNVALSGTDGHIISDSTSDFSTRPKLQFIGNIVGVTDEPSNNTTTVSVSSSPPIGHNELTSPQGGTETEYYHLTNYQHTNIILRSEIAGISSSLSGAIVTNHSVMTGLSGYNVHPAYSISVDTASFSKNLTSEENTAQKAMDKLDELVLTRLDDPDLSALNTSIIPTTNGTLDLGSSTKPFRDIYLTENSIHMGDNKISISGNDLYVNNEVVPSQSRAVYNPKLSAGAGTYVRSVGIEFGVNWWVAGVTDGRYGYFLYRQAFDGSYIGGRVTRLDLQDFSTKVNKTFSSTPNLGVYAGMFTDGRYLYTVPGHDSLRVVRLDLQDFSTVTVLYLSGDAELTGFIGGFTDGRYGYLVPNVYKKVVRFDLSTFSSFTTLNLNSIDSSLVGFLGGFTDGTYAYLIPGNNKYKVVRILLSNFSTVTVLDLSAVSVSLRGFYGGFICGRYGYLVPGYGGTAGSTYHGNVVRIDLDNFSVSGVSYVNIATVDADLVGFRGGFTDGRYGYFAPYGGSPYKGKVAILDLADFYTVSVINTQLSDSQLKGYAAGFTDGRYGYLFPSETFNSSVKVVRIPLDNGGGY